MTVTEILLIIIKFAGALAVFLFSMKMMSEGLQKVAGSRMRTILGHFTGNPVSGILTGTAITAIIQSSSATTVMVVSLVNAGMVSLSGAIAVIMGANIGTTATAWLITLLGLGDGGSGLPLSMLIAAISLIFIFSKRDRMQSIGQTVIGLALLLVGMDLLQAAMPDLKEYPEFLQTLASLGHYGFWSILLFIAIGTVLTCIVQSSSAMMAITLVMCYNNWIDFNVAMALVMGQNIGTTITANIAAVVANTAGKKAARAHLLFNVVGVVITLILFRPMMNLILQIFPHDMPMAITLFHTFFNVGNTILLAFFIPQIIKIVNHMVKEKNTDTDDEPFRLKYIQSALLSTAELNLQSAKLEIEEFSKRVLRMYTFLPALRTAKSQDDFDHTFERIAHYEQITDNMDMEITRYLTQLGSSGVSQHTSQRISSMLRISDNLESIGDDIYHIALIRQSKRADAAHFSDALNANLDQMSALVQRALDIMDANLHDYDHADIDTAHSVEQEINHLRDRLRNEHLEALKSNRYDYNVGNAYSNLYAIYEKLADHVINISEALEEKKE
ncbi:MAG: Na/Pi cotransporter family protein [Bacteroidales bacterium]|nr:Na/Pi cotransporter family protein [Bacteroidales bacterium]